MPRKKYTHRTPEQRAEAIKNQIERLKAGQAKKDILIYTLGLEWEKLISKNAGTAVAPEPPNA